jgi:hypothetical protein
MARLPIIDGDEGDWGIVLNDFLEVSHNADGTLSSSAVATAGAEQTANKNQPSGYAGLNSSTQLPVALLPANIPLSSLNITGTASSSNFIRGDGSWAVPPSASNATTSAPGLVQLAGDLGGTSTSAVAPALANTSNVQSVVNAIIATNTNVTNKAPIASPTFTGKVTTPALQVTTGSGTANQVLTSDTSGNATWATPTAAPVSSVEGMTGAVTGLLQSTNNLNDISNAGTARANIHVPALTPAACVAVANIAGTYVAGTASFTPASATSIDGYSFVSGDLVLLTAQTSTGGNGQANGLWSVPSSGAWTRPTEFSTGANIKGRSILVINGTTYANTQWALDTPTAGITIDTTAQSWSAIGVANGTYAPLASPAFTGTPTTTTGAVGDKSTQIANDAFVQAAFANAIETQYTGATTITSANYGQTSNFLVTASTTVTLPTAQGIARTVLTIRCDPSSTSYCVI